MWKEKSWNITLLLIVLSRWNYIKAEMWLFCIYNCNVVCIKKTTDQQKQVITKISNKGYKQFMSGKKNASYRC